jgi:hypothetical protein
MSSSPYVTSAKLLVSRLAPVRHRHINMHGILTFDLSGYTSSLLRKTPSPNVSHATS